MSTPADAVIPASFTDALSRMQQLEAMVGQLSNPSVLTSAASGAGGGRAVVGHRRSSRRWPPPGRSPDRPGRRTRARTPA